jgi:hypothetical protein
MALANAPSNNGMHPTSDTLPVIYFQSGRRAGDAGRYAASWCVTVLDKTQ